jgi:hypothetical protein
MALLRTFFPRWVWALRKPDDHGRRVESLPLRPLDAAILAAAMTTGACLGAAYGLLTWES